MAKAMNDEIEERIELVRELMLEAVKTNGIEYLTEDEVIRLFAVAKKFTNKAANLRANN